MGFFLLMCGVVLAVGDFRSHYKIGNGIEPSPIPEAFSLKGYTPSHPGLAKRPPASYRSAVSDPDERELIARALRGEADAWDALFDLHYAPTARFLWQIAPGLTHEDVEELAQETFLKVVQRLGQFGGGSRLQTWIFRIAANTARDFRDKQRAAKRGGGLEPLPLDPAPDDASTPLDPPSPAPGPDAVLLRDERFFRLRAALDQLGDPCREIIELRYFGDYSYDQIAVELQLNEKTVSSRLSKCLDKLGDTVNAANNREFSRLFPSNPP